MNTTIPSVSLMPCVSLLAALVSGSVAIVAPASGQVINEDFKLLASDQASLDRFGESIAIDNGIVAVGAGWHNDNGLASGSAYLFDAATGAQVAKLLPNDGSLDDVFGMSVAIANGVVAVGAPGDDDNGTSSGSVYLFDTTTGAQIAKLLPSDGASGDVFGRSVAIANGVVAVGATGDDDNGFDSGSVYLFDALDGTQIVKLLPDDGAAYDEFGGSIAIDDNGIVAVGAKWDEDNGTGSGSAYVFDASTGAQTAKLLPSDGGGWYYHFANSIAIDNGIVAVGSPQAEDNGIGSGSAFLFDASTGGQIVKLLPSDGAEWSGFGHSIAFDNGIVAVGAHLLVTRGSVQGGDGVFIGAAYVFTSPVAHCPVDLDGDGLVDFFDMQIFLNWYSSGDLRADFVADCVIDFFDLQLFLQMYSDGCD